MTISFKACPRCTGDVNNRTNDIFGDDPSCIQCGHRIFTRVTLELGDPKPEPTKSSVSDVDVILLKPPRRKPGGKYD